VDSLQAFLDLHFPERERYQPLTTDLLEELKEYNLSFNDLVLGLNKCRRLLPEVEKAAFLERESCVPVNGDPHWYQVGAIRAILDLTNDIYWSSRRENVPDWVREYTERFRKLLKTTTEAATER